MNKYYFTAKTLLLSSGQRKAEIWVLLWKKHKETVMEKILLTVSTLKNKNKPLFVPELRNRL